MTHLAVPYLSQTDNRRNPFGACNVTSMAMALKYLYPTRNFGCPSGVQLEDHLYQLCDQKGFDKQTVDGLNALMRHLNVPCKSSTESTWGDIQDHLTSGKPVVVHGYFTAYGHIILLRGYDETGYFVNDPYGEWWSTGYDVNVPGNNRKGEDLHYSTRMLKDTCGTDGDLWAHLVG